MTTCATTSSPHDEACLLSDAFRNPSILLLPTPLKPILDSPCRCTLFTPLSLFAAILFACVLILSHLLSRAPLPDLGRVGVRGRKYFSWNEDYGGGGGLFDWLIFGGSVWIRFGHCLFDTLLDVAGLYNFGEERSGDFQNNGGENLFACFGVTSDSVTGDRESLNDAVDDCATPSSVKPVETPNDHDHTAEKRSNHIGILGYDCSLGGHGPLILAPLRASLLILAWCVVVQFSCRTHDELASWLGKVKAVEIKGKVATFFRDMLINLAELSIQGIKSLVGADNTKNIAFFDETNEASFSFFFHTLLYALLYLVTAETLLYSLGKICYFFRIYVPVGVSHPGGPRPHKILRVPLWERGEHYIPKELLFDDKSSHATNNMICQWRCAVARDAHSDTVAKFNSIHNAGDADTLSKYLTGEPFGRQLWTLLESQLISGQHKKAVSGSEDDLENVLKNELLNNNSFENTAVDPLEQKEDMKQRFSTLIEMFASGGRSPPLAFQPSKNPNSCDQLFRAQMISSYLERNGWQLPEEIAHCQELYQQSKASEQNLQQSSKVNAPKSAIEAAKRGIAFYSLLQTSDGHFAGDYGGPHFLLPGLVVAWYVMGCPSIMISPAQQALMLHYLRVHQQTDGGWGTHIESPSTMFGTVICYLAARLLGAQKDETWIARGRAFIKKEGGAIMTASWAKFYLCLIGCMDWKGHNSVPPEMWLLPNWFPFHPGRLWCHCRMVYLPMGYLYGSRFVYVHADSDPLISDLRKELYCQAYDSIDWDKSRHLVAPMDNYSPIPLAMKLAQNCLSVYENWSVFGPFRNTIRKAGLRFCLEYMKAEDLQTNYIDIGPVNKSLNMISAFHAANNDINDPSVRSHMMRVPDYLWIAEDGMKMQGYNGSQCWDTSFAIQAVWECGLLEKFPLMSAKVWAFLERTQILSTETSRSSPAFKYELCSYRDKFYRHVSKGGWPFSTSAHGWPISDCTGEGLKGVLTLMDSTVIMKAVENGVLKRIDPNRLYDAVNVILTLQNEDGGWATYENNRGFGWYEELNPSEVFGDIMIDYSYVECSMASMTALAEFRKKFPNHRAEEIKIAISRGIDFVKSIQREDGSWYGSWACCFCYGCWFGIEGLIKGGEPPLSPAIQKCCRFLISHQRSNGGWGEDFTSCYDKDYAENGMQRFGDSGSGVVNTAWALMALSAAKYDDLNAISRGVRYLMNRQLESGDWPQEGISGVFNRACGITYTAYRNVFPIWALGRCSATYGDKLNNM